MQHHSTTSVSCTHCCYNQLNGGEWRHFCRDQSNQKLNPTVQWDYHPSRRFFIITFKHGYSDLCFLGLIYFPLWCPSHNHDNPLSFFLETRSLLLNLQELRFLPTRMSMVLFHIKRGNHSYFLSEIVPWVAQERWILYLIRNFGKKLHSTETMYQCQKEGGGGERFSPIEKEEMKSLSNLVSMNHLKMFLFLTTTMSKPKSNAAKKSHQCHHQTKATA